MSVGSFINHNKLHIGGVLTVLTGVYGLFTGSLDHDAAWSAITGGLLTFLAASHITTQAKANAPAPRVSNTPK